MADEKMEKMKDMETGELSDEELGAVTGGEFVILGDPYIGGCPGCRKSGVKLQNIDYTTKAIPGYPERHFNKHCLRCGWLFEG